MANVFGRGRINGFLADIGGVIANPFQMPGDEDEIEITAQFLSILSRARDQLLGGVGVHLIKRIVARHQFPAAIDIASGKGFDAVLHHLQCVRPHFHDQLDFAELAMSI